ncbi:MAG: DUF4180 domain-containing protein [Alphaproteobacteria bacterium]|nr:DUF4180 domain-containing protein [Alphaproteobacteria bacterium]
MTIVFAAPDGPLLASEQAALDLMGETYGSDCDMLVVPVARLPDAFFRLSTGLAGAVMQKFSNYGLRVGFVGDISAHLGRSAPLRDFVGETNRHGHIVFAKNETELAALLSRRGGGVH